MYGLLRNKHTEYFKHIITTKTGTNEPIKGKVGIIIGDKRCIVMHICRKEYRVCVSGYYALFNYFPNLTEIKCLVNMVKNNDELCHKTKQYRVISKKVKLKMLLVIQFSFMFSVISKYFAESFFYYKNSYNYFEMHVTNIFLVS